MKCVDQVTCDSYVGAWINVRDREKNPGRWTNV